MHMQVHWQIQTGTNTSNKYKQIFLSPTTENSQSQLHQNQTKLWRSLEGERDFDAFGDLDAGRAGRLAAFPSDSREDLTSFDTDRGRDDAELRFEADDSRRDDSASPPSIASTSSKGSPSSTSLSV